jgi:hypothetical protein
VRELLIFVTIRRRQRLPCHTLDLAMPVWSTARVLGGERRGKAVVEVKGSHAVYVSQPSAVATLIEQAARKVKAAA